MHWKYRFFGRSMENATPPSILEIEQNWCFHWIYHDSECTKMYFCSFILENKFYLIFWTSHTFKKKKQLYEFIKKYYHWIALSRHFEILTSFLFKMNLVPSLWVQNSRWSSLLSAGNCHFSGEQLCDRKWINRRNQHRKNQ